VLPKQHSTDNMASLLVVGVCNVYLRALRLVRLVPHSSVSLLLGFSAMLSVSLVSRVTARSLHDNMLWCQTPSGEWS